MKKIYFIIVLVVLAPWNGRSQNSNLKQVEFLIGTWKIENKESYESWKKEGNYLTGQVYKKNNGQKVISEHIEIRIVQDQIVYTPTVFDQNDGKGIPFKLMSMEDDIYSFENPEHDFPKKIQYQILSRDELYISVLGKNDKGFSYKLIRQSN